MKSRFSKLQVFQFTLFEKDYSKIQAFLLVTKKTQENTKMKNNCCEEFQKLFKCRRNRGKSEPLWATKISGNPKLYLRDFFEMSEKHEQTWFQHAVRDFDFLTGIRNWNYLFLKKQKLTSYPIFSKYGFIIEFFNNNLRSHLFELLISVRDIWKLKLGSCFSKLVFQLTFVVMYFSKIQFQNTGFFVTNKKDQEKLHKKWK